MAKPQVYGRYLLLDRIAYGGMAEVFRGKQFGAEGFDRIIAIKRVLPSVSDDEQFIAMFRDEARITRTLQHGNIAQVYDFGKLDGSYYLAMEYVSGLDLKSFFSACEKRGKPMDPAVAALIISEVAEGLGYAHRATDSSGSSLGLIHRDVSPQNILLGWAGEVKLVDFGIAKARQKTQRTDAGVLKGKFGYMSPEQVRGLPLSNRSDIFSLGVVFWELLTGHRAFDRDSDYATMDAVRSVDVPSFDQVAPDVPETLQQLCLKALSKDEEERYPHAELLGRDLKRWLSQEHSDLGRLELSNVLKETFPEPYSEERQRLRVYERYGSDIIEQEIRTAGSEGKKPSVTINVSSPLMTSTATTRVQNPTPSRAPTPQRAPTPIKPKPKPKTPVARKKPARTSGLRTVLLVLVLAGLGGGGWFGMNWWNTRPGSLLVSTMPSSVDVFVNGENVGTTAPAPDGRGSLLVDEIPHGPIEVELRAKGYSSLIDQVRIRPRKTLSWQANLPQAALPDGKINLKVLPADARVSLDGENLLLKEGAAIVELEGGVKKSLYIQANNHLPHRATLGPLKPGSTTDLNVQLTLERWNLVVIPTPANAKVTLSAKGIKKVSGKGPQTLKGLPPKTPAYVSVRRKRCRKLSKTVRSQGQGERRLEVKLRCR